MDRLIVIGNTDKRTYDDMREIVRDSTFLYNKEHQLQNVLIGAFKEMSFVIHQFQKSHDALLSQGILEDFEDYFKQLNESEPAPENYLIEFHTDDLSTYFKSFLILARALLDKVVPFYSYKFYESLRTFGDKGGKIIRNIKKNKHVVNKSDFIFLIEQAKLEWLDTLITLRDEYVHYSSLQSYINFWIPSEWVGYRTFNGIQDFNKPSIEISGNRVDALQYMLSTKSELVHFLRSFMLLCEFTPNRRPRLYLSCEECGLNFGKRDKKKKQLVLNTSVGIRTIDPDKEYGIIICPKCGGQTDTDLKYWKSLGII